MKRVFLAIAAMTMVLSACGQNKKTEQTQNTQEEKQMKTLVAYFSATGTTKALAAAWRWRTRPPVLQS